jgi:hypothetical protein
VPAATAATICPRFDSRRRTKFRGLLKKSEELFHLVFNKSYTISFPLIVKQPMRFYSIPRELFSDKALLRPRFDDASLKKSASDKHRMFANRTGRQKSKSREKKWRKFTLLEMVLEAAAFLLLFCAANAQNNVRFFLITNPRVHFHLLQIDASDLCPLKIQLWQQILQNGQNQ